MLKSYSKNPLFIFTLSSLYVFLLERGIEVCCRSNLLFQDCKLFCYILLPVNNLCFSNSPEIYLYLLTLLSCELTSHQRLFYKFGFCLISSKHQLAFPLFYKFSFCLMKSNWAYSNKALLDVLENALGKWQKKKKKARQGFRFITEMCVVYSICTPLMQRKYIWVVYIIQQKHINSWGIFSKIKINKQTLEWN